MQKQLVILAFVLFGMLVYTVRLQAQMTAHTSGFELSFVKQDVKVPAGELFNNVLIVKNTQEHPVSFDMFVNTPRNWKVIGDVTQRVEMQPGETRYFPVQVASSGISKGGIGYSVIVVLNDIYGNILASESCFLKIPRNSQLVVETISPYRYFDIQTKEAEFRVKISNKGNTDQYANIKVEPGPSLVLPGNEIGFEEKSLLLEPKQDSVLHFRLKLKESIDNELFTNHRADILVTGSDTIINQTAWFTYLDWYYENPISETKRPLILEIIGNDVFSENPSFWQVRAHGNILFKNYQSLTFDMQNMNTSSSNNDNLWVGSRLFAEYNKSNTSILGVGDYRSNFEQSMHGRGFWAEKMIANRHNIKVAYTSKTEYESTAIGGAYSYKFSIPLSVEFGASHVDNVAGSRQLSLAYTQISSSHKDFGRIRLLYGHSLSNFTLSSFPTRDYQGFGVKGHYFNKFWDNTINARIDFGSPIYAGVSQGRLRGYAQLITPISTRISVISRYNKQTYRPTVISENTAIFGNYSDNDLASVRVQTRIDNNIQVFAGTIFENKETNSYTIEESTSPFETTGLYGEAGFQLSESYTRNTFSFTARYGQTFINSAPENISYRITTKSFTAAELRITMRRNNFSVYANYRQGPNSISEQYAYVLAPLLTRSIMLMPSYEQFIYKQEIKFTMRGSYINNLTAKSSRVNVNSRIDWFIGSGWSAFLDNTFSLTYQSAYQTAGPMANRSHTSGYFRIGLKKIFKFSQPRIKYVDVNAVFFRDNNGDGLRNAGEPGVGNVLANVRRISQPDDDPGLASEFNSVELLSEFEGRVTLRELPVGIYEIDYIPTNGREGNYISNRATRRFEITADTTLDIPFTDLNRVFGYVIINTAENPIDPNPPLDKIKVTANLPGRSPQFTFTDKTGFFEMHIPIADNYRVEIENFDSELYTLRQPFYNIKFNGFKEFEINFVFDEKERKISFDDDYTFFDYSDEDTDTDYPIDFDASTDIEQEYEYSDIEDVPLLQQINIRGEIKEANTLDPLRAEVQVLSRRTGNVLISTVSSARMGNYQALVITNEEISLRVVADGYWVHYEVIPTQRLVTFEEITRDLVMSPIAAGQRVERSDLTFDSNSSELTVRTQTELENTLITLHQNSKVFIEVIGYGDSAEENPGQLSQQRAEKVAEYLKAAGIRPERIRQVRGVGNTVRIGTGEANRSVQIMVAN